LNLEQGWPLVLSSEVSIPGQTTQLPPQLAMMNPTGEPFKIHEIRFSLKTDATYLTGGTFGCKLDLGTVAITNGFIPIWNFGRVISRDQDIGLQFSWRLKHPLYVPGGGILSPNFENFGQASSTVTARVSYFCTAVQREPPNRVFLPWISCYTGKAFQYEDADTDASRETDLLNPFDTDLSISHMMGRFNIFSPTSNINNSFTGSQLLQTRVSLSNGDPLVRTPTPFQQVFGQDGRAWVQRNTVLRPKQFFQVFIDKQATTDSATNVTIQPYVSLIGYREMRVTGGE
jgi:hypothetical protein